MNPERERKLRDVIRQSQPDLTVVLENMFDPLNISAVLRTCDAVGIREVFVVYTRDYLTKRGLILGKKTSAGTFKWIDVYVFDNLETCFERVRERYGRILTTHLAADSTSVYNLDFTQPAALVFGNEDEGVSPEAVALADGNVVIPQAGFAESLNVSVACAVMLFEARRQRALQGNYDDRPRLSPDQQEQLFRRWSAMLKEKSHLRQQAVFVDGQTADLLPFYVERDPAAPPKKPVRPAPLSNFDL